MESFQEPFQGATETTDGTIGLVPAPLAGEQNKFLKGNGSWSDVIVAQYSDNPDHPKKGTVWISD